MSYLFKIIIVLLVLAGLYTLYGIGHFKWMYHSVYNTNTEFLVSGDENSDITIVEFINYGCGHCKRLHPVIEELQQVRKDVRYIMRPILIKELEEEKISRLAIAAGLQGKFSEMHKAFLEYPEADIPDNFIEETALLYGLDYQKLIDDSNGKEVKKILNGNMKAVNHAGIFSVPSFMIGNEIYFVTDEDLPDLKTLLNIIPTSTN